MVVQPMLETRALAPDSIFLPITPNCPGGFIHYLALIFSNICGHCHTAAGKKLEGEHSGLNSGLKKISPKSNDKCPHMRKAEGDTEKKVM